MRVEQLNYGTFWTLVDQVFEPGDGLTLVTGPNGSGKTAAAVDGLAWLLWGETVRGTRSAGNVQGQLVAPDGTMYRVSRTRKGKTTPVLLTLQRGVGADLVDLTGQTPTETQAKVDQLFGSWERHCATRVFSVRLAARFGSATDKERKALLESILGLERFERAADVARGILRDRRQMEAGALQARAAAEAEVTQVERLLRSLPPAEVSVGQAEEAARVALAEIERLDALHGSADRAVQRVEEMLTHLRPSYDQAVQAGRKAQAELVAIEERINEAMRLVHRAGSLDQCPVCLTPGGAISPIRLAKHANDATLAAHEARKAPQAVLDENRATAMDLRDDIVALEAKLADIRKTRPDPALARAAETAGRVAHAALEAARGRAREEARLLAELEAARGRLQDALGAAQEAAGAVGVAVAAVEVLGARGARTRLLEASLAEIGIYANDVLRRLGSDIRLELRGRRQQASGKEVDEVAVVVDGAGGGEYDGTSDGERARLDLAILLGLAAVAGERGGMIAFDEVFDPLDDAGLEGVAELLEEMARERQVVVVTHSPRFTGIVTADQRLAVTPKGDGTSEVKAA